MKNIGLLVPSNSCNKYSYELVDYLQSIKSINLEVFVLGGLEQQSDTKPRFFERVILWSEAHLIKFAKKSKRQYSAYTFNKIPNCKIRDISEQIVASGDTQSISTSSDITSYLRKRQFDFFVALEFSNFCFGEFDSLSTLGILSIAYKNSKYFNLAGLYEVINQSPGTAYSITLKTLESNGQYLVFEGEIPTSPTFLLNQNKLYQAAYYYLSNTIIKYANGEYVFNNDKLYPLTTTSYVSDKQVDFSHYPKNLVKNLYKIAIVLNRDESFGVMYRLNDGSGINENSLRSGTVIENLEGHYFADPFIITRNGRNICFVENYSKEKGRGFISAIELLDKNNYKYLGPVIDEPFHLSFPFMFEYEDVLYMVPESSQDNSIRLYKCLEFPLSWEFQDTLLDNQKAVDTLIFEQGNKWWMLSNMVENSPYEVNTNLNIFSSNSPISGDWEPHQQNPVTQNCRSGRNAGIIFSEDNKIVRIRQHYGFLEYGVGFSGAEIEDMSLSEFAETEIFEIKPSFKDNIIGCHHMNSNSDYLVYDLKYQNSFLGTCLQKLKL